MPTKLYAVTAIDGVYERDQKTAYFESVEEREIAIERGKRAYPNARFYLYEIEVEKR